MKTKILSLCCGVLLLASCATTKVVETLRDDSMHPKFSNVLVVAAFDDEMYRPWIEHEITYHFRAAGYEANAAVDVLSTTATMDRAAAELAVKKTGADCVMVVRRLDVKTEEVDVPASLAVSVRPLDSWFWYYSYSVRLVPLEAYTETYRTTDVETTLFDTAASKRVWSARTTTTERRPSDALNSYVKAMGKQLRETGLFK